MGFKENVKSELQFRDLQIKQLAALSGIKQQTLASYLGSRAKVPSVEAAVKIAGVLGVSVEYLVTGEETPCKQKFSSLAPDIRMVLQTMENLDSADRKIVLNMAALLKERETLAEN
ncbi:MAG: helix-turn-helix domain-containing protein [Treponema sp.]|jgi:transcriptional regulator with XRE-family HTH domain|nr:helix-turn-helix domain-containing protein [Treponema sp.]